MLFLKQKFNLSLSRDLPLAPSISGMFAIRTEREYVESEDFMKAVRKVSDYKKLVTKLDYKQI
jgi:ATP-dependent 26S proteasome regulatory subunit